MLSAAVLHDEPPRRAREPGGQARVADTRSSASATAPGSGRTTSASRSSWISSCTHGRSDSTHGTPHAIASHTERGELSLRGTDTNASAAR